MISALLSTSRQSLLTWTQVLVFASVLLVAMSPFTSPALVGGAFAVQAFWIQRDHGDLWAILRSAAVTRGWIAIAAFIAYLAVRLFPSAPITALPGVGSMIAYSLFVFGAFALFPRQNEDVQTAIANAFLVAFGVAAALHVFEFLSGFALRRWLWTWAPIFRPRPGKIDVDGGTVRILVPFIANQASAALVALIWPVLMMDALIKRERWQRLAIWAALALAAAAILLSDQVTSKMALVVGLATWVVVTLLPRSARPLLTIAWVASTLLVLPAAWYGYKAEGYRYPPNFSAKHRVVIWGVTAEKTFEHPWIGIGTGHTSDFDEMESPTVRYVPDTKIPIATNRHAHNVFLQAWYEGGLIGAVLLLLAGLPVIAWIGKAPLRAQPLLAAAFTGGIMSASFSYSLLASWFLATFAMTALFCRFTLVMAEGDRGEI